MHVHIYIYRGSLHLDLDNDISELHASEVFLKSVCLNRQLFIYTNVMYQKIDSSYIRSRAIYIYKKRIVYQC